ncbi:ribose 5-phosphate isomerase B [Collinsella sp. zg1085]|uniref:ribose 5-phosphate isomerase B n=1 Tax=Collinsella sp. zg1085 TaxID=2844380 RepID=UPI001C0D8B6C|nr:ribose 5-phosphate isomerase B [Collinsella sp. zg1085]QWT17721.1 ribose 5-phosphate isomerase B [Collinsella sp. zg1085]
MRIALGSDHAGFEQKQLLLEFIQDELGHEVVDCGPATDDRVDYPDFGERVGQAVASGAADRGVCVCGTGIGIALAANKIPGIRASSITTSAFADLFRRHNDGNVIGLSGRFIDPELNREIVRTFLSSEFEGGRHAERVAKIMKLDHVDGVEHADSAEHVQQSGGASCACEL